MSKPPLPFLDRRDVRSLQWLGRQMAANKVVLFVGAGFSRNAPRRDGSDRRMPDWWNLAGQLRQELEPELAKENDVLKIADYYETTFGRTALVEKVAATVGDLQYEPAKVHRLLVQMRLPEIITTNYDTLIERAYQQESISPHVVVNGSDLVHPSALRIIKMNGCFERNPSEIVITGDDFLAYSESHPLIQAFVTKSFVESRVLFIGFSLEDPAFRAINERVLQTLGNDTPYAHSLWFHPTATQKEYWLTRKIRIIDIRPRAFEKTVTLTQALEEVLQYLVQVQEKHIYLTTKSSRPKLLTRLAETFPKPPKNDDATPPATGGDPASSTKDDDPARPSKNAKPWPNTLNDWSKLLADNPAGAPAGAKKRLITASDIADTAIDVLKEKLHPEIWLRLRRDEILFIEHLVDYLLRAGEADESTSWSPTTSTLTTLWSLSLLIVGRQVRGSSGEKNRQLTDHTIRAMRLLDAGSLQSNKAAMRWKSLTMLTLCAPLEKLGVLIASWLQGASGKAMIPDLFKAPLLGFHGVLFADRKLAVKAAKSVFSVLQEITEPSIVSSEDDLEVAYRYRYLTRAFTEGDRSWHGAHHYLGAIEQALGQSMLQPVATQQPVSSQAAVYPDSSAHHLMMVLRALMRGWIYSTHPPPDSIRLAWENAAIEESRNESDQIPWEALVILTLATDGQRLGKEPTGLLHRAWLRDELDAAFLIDFIALRLQGRGFQTLDAPGGDGGEEHGARLYERHLANLVRWIARRVATEANSSPLRQKLVDELALAVSEWLIHTEDDESRKSLLYTLAYLRSCDADRVGPRIRKWVSSQLQGGEHLIFGLSILVPAGSSLPLDRPQLLKLIEQAKNKDFRGNRDLTDWLIAWSSSADFNSPILKKVAKVVAKRLVENARNAKNGNLTWVPLAASIARQPELREHVDDWINQHRSVPGTTLYEFLESQLQVLDGKGAERWPACLDGFRVTFVPFAPQINEELLPMILGEIVPDKTWGREGSLQLLVAFLLDGSSAVVKAHRDQWLNDIEAMIAAGATGEGTIGPIVSRLSASARATLQDNLVAKVVETAPEIRTIEAVGWIAKTLTGSPDFLPDLEEGLVELITSSSLDVAQASLEAVLELCDDTTVAGFCNRQRRRLRRVFATVEARGGYRKSSQFAAELESLRELLGPS